ncbi:MAG: outer membrane protein transport protein [Bacteroidales bacterium]|jgi:hypothetical protein|nr:outer membrane protein transport protein [Bacteroidales bacterium]
MKKIIVILTVVLISLTSVYGQYASEALRYSHILQGGTSRANAMSGSFNGLGGDAGSLYFNPAGIGVYRSFELSVTPSFEFQNSKGYFLENNNSDFEIGANINSFSVISSIKKNENNFNFGISYTKLNNFDENILIKGINNSGSMTDWFAARGKNTFYEKLDDYYSNLAWNGYLINPTDSTATNYVSAYNQYGEEQRLQISRSGYQGEYSFSLGGSIGRKLFLGATLGLQSIRFNERKITTETDVDDVIDHFNMFEFKENLKVSGTGVNFKFGFLVSPIEWVRFGVAFHTPTFYYLEENYSTSLYASTDQDMEKESPEGGFEYQLNTPFRANVSAGFIVKNFALINLEYEYLNYTFAKLRSNDGSLEKDNEEIRDSYKSGNNVRLGLEYIVTSMLSLRAGAGFYSSPYKNPQTNKTFTLTYSAGLGLKIGQYTFLDFSYTYYDLGKSLYYLYDSYGVTSPLASINNIRNRFTLTLGFKF